MIGIALYENYSGKEGVWDFYRDHEDQNEMVVGGTGLIHVEMGRKTLFILLL